VLQKSNVARPISSAFSIIKVLLVPESSDEEKHYIWQKPI